MKITTLICIICVMGIAVLSGCIDLEEEVFGTFSEETVIITEIWTDGNIGFVSCEGGDVYSTMPPVENELEVGKEYEVKVFHHKWGDNMITEILHKDEWSMLQWVMYLGRDQ